MQALSARGAPGLRIQWWWLPATAPQLLLALLVLPRCARDADLAVRSCQRPERSRRLSAPCTCWRSAGRSAKSVRRELHAARAARSSASTIHPHGRRLRARLSLAAGGEGVLVAPVALVLPAEQGLLRLERARSRALVPRAEGERPSRETALARIEAIARGFRL